MNRRRSYRRKPGSSGRRWVPLAVIVLTAVVTAMGMWLFFQGKLAENADVDAPAHKDGNVLSEEMVHVQLFFSDPDGVHLVLHGAMVTQNGEITERIKQIIAALARGPGKRTNAAPVLWEQARVREVYFNDLEDTVYVDFNQPFLAPGTFSVLSERLSIAAVVNSICFNFQQVSRVRILIGGKDVKRLGHLDLDQPFERNRDIVKQPSGA